MGFKPGLTADNEPETLKAQAFSVGQSEYSGQVNDAVRSSATATEFLATDGNPVLQGGEDVITPLLSQALGSRLGSGNFAHPPMKLSVFPLAPRTAHGFRSAPL